MTSDDKQKPSVIRVDFLGLLLLLFIGLKLTGHIDWSWFWVLSPIWMPVAFLVAGLALFAIVAALFSLVILILDRFVTK